MALERHYIADSAVVFIMERFVEREADGGSDAEFGKIQKLQDIEGRGIKTKDFRAEAIEKNLS